MSTAHSPDDLPERRRRAEHWVNGYTATAVAAVLATTPIPGGATAVLCALEATMCYQIGKIYKTDWSMAEASAAAGVIGLAAFAGKIVVLEGSLILGPFAFVAKPAIAAGIVKTMGKLVIKHFEDCAQPFVKGTYREISGFFAPLTKSAI